MAFIYKQAVLILLLLDRCSCYFCTSVFDLFEIWLTLLDKCHNWIFHGSNGFQCTFRVYIFSKFCFTYEIYSLNSGVDLAIL